MAPLSTIIALEQTYTLFIPHERGDSNIVSLCEGG